MVEIKDDLGFLWDREEKLRTLNKVLLGMLVFLTPLGLVYRWALPAQIFVACMLIYAVVNLRYWHMKINLIRMFQGQNRDLGGWKWN